MENLTASIQSDALSSILQAIRFKSTVFCRSDLTAPWGFSVDGKDIASFHIIVQGKCCLEVEGVKPIPISAGDLCILPHGHPHVMRDAPGSPVTRLEDLLVTNPLDAQGSFRHGGGGALSVLVCGGFEFENRSMNPLLHMLPPLLHIRGESGQAPTWLQFTLQSLGNEITASRPGAETVVARLADIIFIQAVRTHFAGPDFADQNWLTALKDPQISEALSLIYRQPEMPWTVNALARRVGMSRTAFSTKFSLLIGESPLRYVTRCRMNKALSYLRLSNATITQIAEQVGYDSEAAFSRAFKRHVGISPGAYRRGSKQ